MISINKLRTTHDSIKTKIEDTHQLKMKINTKVMKLSSKYQLGQCQNSSFAYIFRTFSLITCLFLAAQRGSSWHVQGLKMLGKITRNTNIHATINSRGNMVFASCAQFESFLWLSVRIFRFCWGGCWGSCRAVKD